MPMNEIVLRKNWIYIVWKNFLYIDIQNPKKTISKIKGVFKSPKSYYKFTKDKYAPYPVLWVSKPAIIQIMAHDVGWKDKYDTPRYEVSPYIWIHIYKWNFVWYWEPNCKEISDFWEQVLWYLYYIHTISYGRKSKPDLESARKSWPWTYENNKSTWNDGFLI